MIRLLIVEDELIEREALKLMVRGNFEEITSIEDAENGFEAIEKCKKQIPHIVIIDVNMPGINGLDTIKEIKKISNQVHFVILSAYNRFEFAQEAIQLGVEDFLVKPTNLSDICNALNKVMDKIESTKDDSQESTMFSEQVEEIRPIVERDCIYSIIYGRENGSLEKMLGFLGFQVRYGFCFGVSCEKSQRMVLNLIKKTLSEMGFTCIGEGLHYHLIFFYFDEKQIKEGRREELGRFLEMLLKENGYLKHTIAVGGIVEGCDSLIESYKEVLEVLKREKAAETKFYLSDQMNEEETTYLLDLDKLTNKGMIALNAEEKEELKSFSGWLIQQLSHEKEQVSEVGGVLHQLLSIIVGKIQSRYSGIELPDYLFPEHLLNAENVQDLENQCYLFLQKMQQEIWSYQKLNHSGIIRKAMASIESGYAGDVSLNRVANELGISVYYLSKMVKKGTGKNFTDILAEKRIDKAKELLTKNLSVKEVTYLVGFNSQTYFTKVFKKYVGCTPREYKQMMM